MECNFKRHTWVATHSSGPPAAVALATQPFSGLTITVLKGQTLIVNTLQLFPSTVIMHTVHRVGLVIKENYSTWIALVSSIGPVFAVRGLCFGISIADASVDVVSAESYTQDPSREQKHHRGTKWQFSCFVRNKWALDHWQGSLERSNLLRRSPSQPFKKQLKTLMEEPMGMRATPPFKAILPWQKFPCSMFSGNISDVRIIYLGDRVLSFSLTQCEF